MESPPNKVDESSYDTLAMTVHLFLICLILEKSIFEVVMSYESDGDGGQVSLQRILNGRCSVRSLSRLEKS